MTETLTVLLNGAPRELANGSTVAEAVAAVSVRSNGLAVAVNGAVVPRAAWAATVLAAGDQIEVLTAVQGG